MRGLPAAPVGDAQEEERSQRQESCGGRPGDRQASDGGQRREREAAGDAEQLHGQGLQRHHRRPLRCVDPMVQELGLERACSTEQQVAHDDGDGREQERRRKANAENGRGGPNHEAECRPCGGSQQPSRRRRCSSSCRGREERHRDDDAVGRTCSLLAPEQLGELGRNEQLQTGQGNADDTRDEQQPHNGSIEIREPHAGPDRCRHVAHRAS